MTDTIKISRELRPVLSITDEQLAEIDRAANGACQYSQDDWFSFHDFLAFYASDDAEFLSAVSPWVVIALITRLRAAENKLRALEPIAADMGGQAGEEVEVVAYIDEHDSLCHLAPRTEHFALMTVSQHLRILAKHRQQAGKLAEALRIIHFRADCFVEDDMDMRVPSIEAIVRIAGEALADWEKTNA